VHSVALDAPAAVATSAEEVQLAFVGLDDHEPAGSTARTSLCDGVRVPITPSCLQQRLKRLHALTPSHGSMVRHLRFGVQGTAAELAGTFGLTPHAGGRRRKMREVLGQPASFPAAATVAMMSFTTTSTDPVTPSEPMRGCPSAGPGNYA
jgi:hypothetical protein